MAKMRDRERRAAQLAISDGSSAHADPALVSPGDPEHEHERREVLRRIEAARLQAEKEHWSGKRPLLILEGC